VVGEGRTGGTAVPRKLHQFSEIENEKDSPFPRIANHIPYKTTVCIKTKYNYLVNCSNKYRSNNI
jgi:hypothetical protein